MRSLFVECFKTIPGSKHWHSTRLLYQLFLTDKEQEHDISGNSISSKKQATDP